MPKFNDPRKSQGVDALGCTYNLDLGSGPLNSHQAAVMVSCTHNCIEDVTAILLEDMTVNSK